MEYSNARDLIQDGDVIFIKRPKGSYNPFSWISTTLLQTPFYHTATAVWMESSYGNRRLMVVEAHAGARRMVPMSIYRKNGMEVLRWTKMDFGKVADRLIEKVGYINYGYADFIAIGIKEIFGLPSRDHTGEVCSEMAAKMLVDCGYTKINDALVSPKKLYELMMCDIEECKQVAVISNEV